MKTKLFLLTIIPFLLTGCFSSKKKSSNSNSGSGGNEPTEFGYGYYGGYYGQLKWSNGEDLKNKLHAIIRNGYQPLSYNTPNWETNSEADKALYDQEYLDVLYSKDDVYNQYTDSSWQREHAFCASLLTGSTTGPAVKFLGRATDFHNLFAGSANGNMSRGNKNYGIADTTSPTYTNRTVDNGNDGYSYDPKTFEPGNKDKGRVARAIFYVATMYKDDEQDTVNGKLMKGITIVEEHVDWTKGEMFSIGHLSELLAWNNTWSVDYLEMQHNESVYSHVYSKEGKAQGNRNPFVDYPSLVDYVFGSKKDQAGDLNNQKPSAYDLKSNLNEFSHYAIGTAKREYNVGETLEASDFTVYKVNKNYTHTEAAASEYTNSLLGHVFTAGDGEEVTATITAGEQTINYTISLGKMQGCSFYSEMDKTGISNTVIGTDQNITRGGTAFTINVTGTSGYLLQNSSKPKGVKMGSNPNPVTRVVLTTVSSFTINEAYISCCGINTSSSYQLTIKVGADVVYTSTVPYDANATRVFGSEFSSKTGQVSFILEGSSALVIGAIAFNVVS